MEHLNVKQMVRKQEAARNARSVDPRAVRDAVLRRYNEKVKERPTTVVKAQAAKEVAPSLPEKKVVAVAPVAPQAQTSESPTRGIFIGFDPTDKLFFKVVGNVKDNEYLSLVKYAELQMALTLDLFNPTSNLKLMNLVREALGKDKKVDSQAS